ncbi:MAG: hypothetical protein NW241_14485 [Bacteroidia bacterium]|nr:hypothetical protein [Bacteroidia bacterium]
MKLHQFFVWAALLAALPASAQQRPPIRLASNSYAVSMFGQQPPAVLLGSIPAGTAQQIAVPFVNDGQNLLEISSITCSCPNLRIDAPDYPLKTSEQSALWVTAYSSKPGKVSCWATIATTSVSGCEIVQLRIEFY